MKTSSEECIKMKVGNTEKKTIQSIPLRSVFDKTSLGNKKGSFLLQKNTFFPFFEFSPFPL